MAPDAMKPRALAVRMRNYPTAPIASDAPYQVVKMLHIGDSVEWQITRSNLADIIALTRHSVLSQYFMQETIYDAMRKFYDYDRALAKGEKYLVIVTEKFVQKMLKCEDIQLYSDGTFA